MKTRLFIMFALLALGFTSVYAQKKKDNPLDYDYYIYGNQKITGKNSATLSEIDLKGFSSTTTGIIDATIIEKSKFLTPIDKEKYKENYKEKLIYQFEEINTYPKLDLENAKFQYWRHVDGEWITDSESGTAAPNNQTDKDACFVLVLDCSHSLGERGFLAVKDGARTFINQVSRYANLYKGNIRIGVIWFSTMEDTDILPITPLTYENKSKMLDFIDKKSFLDLKKATAMYYAVNKGVDLLTDYTKKTAFEEFEGAHIITFTDGLDNTSQLVDKEMYAINEVTAFVENKMKTTIIKDSLIDRWTIGLRGKDVPENQVERMQKKLQLLASNNKQFVWVEKESELIKKFEEIAKNLTDRWQNLIAISALNHSGPVCWTLGEVKAPKPVSKDKHMLLGVNMGLGLGTSYTLNYYNYYYSSYEYVLTPGFKITVGIDAAYPITNKFGLGGYMSLGAAAGCFDFTLGALSTIGDHDKNRLKYIAGLGFNTTDYCFAADLRFGLMFRNGLYLMANTSFGEIYGATINLGYDFGKFFKVK